MIILHSYTQEEYSNSRPPGRHIYQVRYKSFKRKDWSGYKNLIGSLIGFKTGLHIFLGVYTPNTFFK